MMYPPDEASMRFDIHSDAIWEASERYIRLEVFCRASTSVYESLLSIIGYDPVNECYRMWMFARSQAEPMYLSGNFVDGCLILVGEPSAMIWGTQKMRYSFTLEGWHRYCTARMQRCE
jgi:hypothetical protein